MAEEKQIKNYIAVDIGSFSIKFIQINKDNGINKFLNYSVRNYKLSETRRFEEIKDILAEELSSTKFNAKDIIVFANLPSLNFHIIPFPDIPENEIKKSAKFKAKKLVPYNLAESYYDCIVNEKIGIDNRINSIFISALKTEVEGIVELFSTRKKDVKIFSIRSIGIQKLLLERKEEIENSVHIDIGHEQTIINIFKNNKQQFSRVIPMGFSSIIESSVKEILENSEDFNEIYEKMIAKMETVGFVLEDERKELSEEDAKYSEAIEEGILRLVQRVRLTLGYFKTQSKISKFDIIYISGGGANICGIKELLKVQFAVEVEYLNIPENILGLTEKFKEDFLLFPSITGIQLCKPKEILNLIPEPENEKKVLSSNADIKEIWKYLCYQLEHLKYPKLVYGTISTIIIGLCIMHFIISQYNAYSYKREKKNIEKEIISINNIKSQLNSFEQTKQKIEKENQVIEQNFKDNIKFNLVLNELLKDIWNILQVKEINYRIQKNYRTVDDKRVVESEYIIDLTAKCKDVSEIKKVKNILIKNSFFSEVNAKDTNFIKEKTKNGTETFVNFIMSVKIDKETKECFYSTKDIANMKKEITSKK